MDFRQLEVFKMVIDCTGFSEAATRLGLTQPTVSSHVRDLEQELDVLLIKRTTKRFEITAEGKRLYNYAADLLSLRERIFEEFKGKGEHSLRLGASTVPGTYLLPTLISAFMKVNPETKLWAFQSDSQDVLEKLENGVLDLAFVGTSPQSDRFKVEVFAEDELVLAAPATEYYRKLKQDKVPLTRLLQEPLIAREHGSGTQKEAERILEDLGVKVSLLNFSTSANDHEMIKRLIKGGSGLSILSSRVVAEDVTAGRIITFNLNSNKNSRQLYMVYCANAYLSQSVLQFIDFVREANTGHGI